MIGVLSVDDCIDCYGGWFVRVGAICWVQVFPLGAFGTPYFHDAQMQGPTLTDSIFNTLPLFNMTLSADTGRPFTTQETASLNQAIRTEVLRLYTNELSQRKNQLFFRVGEHQRCNSFNEPGSFIQEICYPHSLACLELPSGPVLTSIGLNQSVVISIRIFHCLSGRWLEPWTMHWTWNESPPVFFAPLSTIRSIDSNSNDSKLCQSFYPGVCRRCLIFFTGNFQ